MLDRDAARERIAVDAHELRRGAEVYVRARHVVAHEHVVHLEARLRRDGPGHVDARHVLAPHVHLQRRFDADEPTADHDDAVAHVAAVAQGLGREVHLRAVEPRDGLRRDGPAAGRPENVVGRIGRGELRRRRGVKAHGDVVDEQLALEIADHTVHVALEKRLAGAQGVAADVAARLPDLDRVAGLLGIERGHAAGRAGADDEELFRVRRRRDVDAAVLVAAARVERAGRRLAVVDAGDAALIAGDARANRVRPAGEHLVR